MIFKFSDNNSGGSRKTEYGLILIEANSEDEAAETFRNKLECDPYGQTPERWWGYDHMVYDFEIEGEDSLEKAIIWERGGLHAGHFDAATKKWSDIKYFETTEQIPKDYIIFCENKNPYMTMEEFLKDPNVLFIPKNEMSS